MRRGPWWVVGKSSRMVVVVVVREVGRRIEEDEGEEE